jgi:hypothetical protein
MEISVTQKAMGLLGGAVQANRWLIILTTLHAGATILAADRARIAYDNGAVQTLMTLFGTLIPAYLFVLLIWRVVHMIRHERPKRPSAWLMADIRATVLDAERLVNGLLALVVMSIFFNNFSFIKEAIPALNPFGWDVFFMQMDRVLHGGVDPYVLLMPVFGHPMMLQMLSGAYVLWLFALYFVVFIACFTKANPAARASFLAAFALTWAIGGNLVAIVFASVGPVFYAPLGLGDVFAPLMAHLHLVHETNPLSAVAVQDMLWSGYASGDPMAGISAFPSMHVASSALLACYAFSYARWAGVVLSLFLGAILIGSVMLGWHYAVDGYAGIAIAWASWKLACRVHQPKANVAQLQSA